MSSLFNILVVGALGAIGTHVCHAFVKKTGLPLGSLVEMTFHKRILQGFQACIEHMQYPIDQVRSLQTEIILNHSLSHAARYHIARTMAVCNTVLIAPAMEELIYRGPQVLGGMVSVQIGIYSPLTQIIIGISTNIIFGLAHSSFPDVTKQLKSDQFQNAASKGAVLSVVAGVFGLAPAIVAHSLSNALNYIK